MQHKSLNRRLFLGGGAAALGLSSGCTKAPEPPPGADKADLEAGDAILLIEAAGFEQLAINVYTAAAGLAFIKADRLVITTAARFMGQHEEHRDALLRAARQLGLDQGLGVIKEPDIPKNVLDESLTDDVRKVATLQYARSLEMQAAQAYYAHVTQKLRTEGARRIVADILPVEAQHVAIYDLLLGNGSPSPTPFFSEQV